MLSNIVRVQFPTSSPLLTMEERRTRADIIRKRGHADRPSAPRRLAEALERRLLLSLTTQAAFAGTAATTGGPRAPFAVDVENTNGMAPIKKLVIKAPGTHELTASDGSLNAAVSAAVGSYSLKSISFAGDDGGDPGAVTLDSSGDLFGTTGVLNSGDNTSPDTVFEIAHGTTLITTLAAFSKPNGDPFGVEPNNTVTVDSSGDLFGTTFLGGVNGDGSVFEIATGTKSITTLASFDAGSNNYIPYTDNGVTLDSSGDLFGTTEMGGNTGTVFEIAHGTNTITTLASISGTGGNAPGAVALDSGGDLFSTTGFGGAAGDGSVFEIPSGTTSITTLASFDVANSYPVEVTLDPGGNLFGTTSNGGAGGYGTVFEIGRGTTSITTLASFDKTNGFPTSGVTLDSAGDLFGTTAMGGAGGDGSVFEIAYGTASIRTLITFSGTNGSNPGAVTIDSSGNLFGATEMGGKNNDGTVFELTPTSANSAALTPNVARDSLPAEVVAGAKLKATVTVDVTDSGTAASGPATITLYASTAATLTGATPIGMLAVKNLKLKAGKTQGFSFKISKLPATLAAGTYYVVAEVTGNGGSSTPAAAAGTVTVAPPFVTLTASAVSPPKAVKPGGKASAVLTIGNSGNIAANGPLVVALGARPEEPPSTADIAIQVGSTKIRIKPGATARVKLTFRVPKTLETGAYSLVAQVDANNFFNEMTLPSPIDSVTAFTVT